MTDRVFRPMTRTQAAQVSEVMADIAETCERCGDECSEMLGGLCCDCIRRVCEVHGVIGDGC